MKYCLDFKRQNKTVLNEVDEINFSFDIAALLDFLEHYNDKRINIQIEKLEDCDIKRLIKICQENSNFNIAIKLPYYSKEETQLLQEANIPFFFNTFANNWDIFTGLVSLGVSDIYITEELGFELNKVAAIAHSKNIQLRAFPNVCQSAWKEIDCLKTFFIRPEDISIYEQYIDVFEFFGDTNKQKILFKIYKDEKWFGKLGELILGFNTDLDSRFIIPNFAEQRVKCGKKCLKGDKCQICERIVELSKTLEKSKIIVKKKKKESENNG